MFSLDYFKYLLKSKKGFLIFEGLVALLIIVVSGNIATASYLAMMIGLSFFLTLNVFNYVHSKKAVDTYFALPVSRKAMLGTGIIFSFIFSYVPAALGTIVKLWMRSELYSSEIYLVFMALAILSIVMFNAAIYLIANNSIDGIVILGSYTLLPLFLFLAADIFLEVFVCGYDGESLNWISYLSPVYTAINIYANTNFSDFEFIDIIPHIITELLFIALSIVILKKEYIERKVERAETISKGLFAYPIIISVYMALALFGISSNFIKIGIIDFLVDYFGLYLLLFITYMMANFLYKRKFEMNIKLPVVYVVAVVLSLLFATVAINCKGFGISYSYLGNTEATRYQFEIYDYSAKEDASYYDIFNSEVREWIKEESGYDGDCINVHIKADNTIGDGPALKEETIDLLEGMRKKATDNFYNEEKTDDYLYYRNMNVSNGCYIKKGNVQCTSYHDYHYVENLTLDDYKKLANDENVEFEFEFADGTYVDSKHHILNMYDEKEGY